MRYLQRYFLLLCVLAMCVGLFSTTAHADSSPVYKLFVQTDASQIGLNSNNAFYDGDNYNKYASSSGFLLNNTTLWSNKLVFTLTDETDYILFESGKTYDLRIENLFLDFSISFADGTVWNDDPSKYKPQQLYMHYTDGSRETISINLSYNDKTDSFTITGTFVAPKDVKSMYFEVARYGGLTVSSDPILSQHIGQVAYLNTFYGARETFALKITNVEESKETGLLRGLGQKLTNVWNAITDGFSKLQESTDKIVSGILNLPLKIWEFIENGLKALFVPDPDYMASYKDKWDSLLAKQLGAVYQVKEILSESWDSVMNADETNTIEFPSATINLPDGNKFTFGGYTVQVVPTGFSVLVTAIKSIIGIVCTVAFVNGMRKRYDEVMGVEQ